MTRADDQPFCILIAALGGEGGGVLMNWIVEAARASGFAVQATSVPGVAQRTGSTSYYIEIMRRPPNDQEPVFALVPMPGRVDVVVASELVEAGRILERGFVSPSRTTLITSTSRFYTTAEKMEMGDGRFPPDKIESAGRALARRFVALDLESIAKQHATLVSAAMFGALAGAGGLPFDINACEAAIGTGKSAQASRAGFRAAAVAVATLPRGGASSPASAPPIKPVLSNLDDLIGVGRARCLDYQDAAYADLYATRVSKLRAAATSGDPVTTHALEEAARRLALWMAYEDIPRVADLKTRPERFQEIRREAEMTGGQILQVSEILKPGAEEIADMLPVSLGERIMRRLAKGKSIPLAGHGLNVTTTNAGGYLIMRALARMKSIRPRSLRFRDEQRAIDQWLAAMTKLLPRDPAFAAALAELPRVLKGYGDTHTRGRRAYAAIDAAIVTPAVAGTADAVRLRKAIAAAMADPDHKALTSLLAAPTAIATRLQ